MAFRGWIAGTSLFIHDTKPAYEVIQIYEATPISPYKGRANDNKTWNTTCPGILAPDAGEVQAALNTLDLFAKASATAQAELARLTLELNAAKENALATTKAHDRFREQLKIALRRINSVKNECDLRPKMSQALVTDLKQTAEKFREMQETAESYAQGFAAPGRC
ncbi:hypothetical protein DFH09DRAFT_1278507 [Mycena vulgaris]|nr:hypothetical protein DFH09DRAFT_1278507 [Mycena vulgaris]